LKDVAFASTVVKSSTSLHVPLFLVKSSARIDITGFM